MNTAVTSPTGARGAFGARKKEVLHQSLAHSLQAEQALIGAFLESPLAVYDQLAGKLTGTHFLDPFCKLAFEKGMELASNSNVPDLIMLATAIDGYVSMDIQEIESELADIYDRYPSSSNVQGWSSILLDKYVQRQIDGTGERLRELAHAQDFSAEEKIAEATRMLGNAAAALATDDVLTTEDMVFDTLAKIEARMVSMADGNDEPTGLTFGFPEIDEVTTGMHAAELIVVAGRPGMGKTAFAMAMAKAIAALGDKSRRQGVLMFSLEMSPDQMGMRWLSTLYNVPVKDMRSGKIKPDDWARLQAGLVESKDFPFSVDKKSSATVDHIVSTARKIHREKGLGIVIIDYLQLIETSTRAGANRSELIGEISRKLKNLSRELNIPVVALSQLNRKLEERQDKRPIMSDLRESGAIEQDADIIMFLYRDDYYNKNSTEPGIAEVIIVKQRNGQPCTVKLGWDGPTTSFSSLDSHCAGATSTAHSVAMAFDQNCASNPVF